MKPYQYFRLSGVLLAMVTVVALVLGMLSRANQGAANTSWQWYKVDTHVHSSVSADAFVDLGIISDAAKTLGYDALFLTDHNGASSFQINNLTANHMAFEDAYTRWTIGTYGSLSSTANSLVSTPVNSGTKSLRLLATSSSYGESYIWTKRGPNFRAGDIILQFSIYPKRIDSGSGVYVAAAIGGDPTVSKNPNGYTTQDGVPHPGKSTVLVWQLGNGRAASSDPNARVIVFPLAYTLNTWNHYTINVSQALQSIPLADRPLDYNGLVHLKMAAAGKAGTAEAYFDTYSIDASTPTDPAYEYIYRTSVVNAFDTATFKIFPSYEMGQQRHTQRFNFGITQPSEYRSYASGTQGILETQQSGYPAQLNHPGVTITADEAVQTQGAGADFIEVSDPAWVNAWDGILEQGVIILGQWSSDTHSAGFTDASYLYAPALDFNALIQAMYEGRSYDAPNSFAGRVIFTPETNSSEPYPARYPVFVSDAASSANVRLNISADVSSSYTIRWVRNGVQMASDGASGSSYNATKAVSLSGAFTYARAELLSSNGTLRALTQPVFFIDVPSLPNGMSFHVQQVTNPGGNNYTRIATKGITQSTWNTTSNLLWMQMENPVGALVETYITTPSGGPQRVRVDNVIIPASATMADYDTANSSAWYYDSAAKRVYLKTSQAGDTSSVMVEFASNSDTTPPTAPSNLAATAINPGQVNLSWDASSDQTGVSGYTIYRDGQNIGQVDGSSLTYADTSVSGGTQYSYTVTAFDPFGNVSASSSPATVTTPVAGSFSFTPEADSYIDTSKAGTNYGASTSLRVDATPYLYGYLRFNVQGLAGQVTRARLRLYTNTSSSIGYSVHSVADTTWGEMSLVPANAPAMGSAVGTSGSYAISSWTEVDVTSLVSGDGLLSLGLQTTSGTALSYSSREGNNPPQLIIDTSSSTSTPTTTVTATTATPTPTDTATPTPTDTTTPTDTPVPSDTPTPPPVVTFTTEADSYVYETNPTSNYGNSSVLRIDASPVMRSYVRFNVQGISGTITSARLRLYASSSVKAGTSVSSTDSNWSETGITYNNVPAAISQLASLGAFSSGTWIEIDVTGYVTGNGTFSFMLATSSSTAASFSSKEGANAPVLVVETTP